MNIKEILTREAITASRIISVMIVTALVTGLFFLYNSAMSADNEITKNQTAIEINKQNIADHKALIIKNTEDVRKENQELAKMLITEIKLYLEQKLVEQNKSISENNTRTQINKNSIDTHLQNHN